MEIEKALKEIAEDSWLTQIRNYVPSAWLGHAPFLRYLIREVRPDIFVELGTHHGFSYFVACQTVQELGLSTRSYAVDNWVGDPHAGKFDESVYEGVLALNEQYKDFSTLLKMSFLETLAQVSDASVNLLHIDGFHTYDAVRQDFETWLPKMQQNGVVILHDIHVRFADYEVFKYWSELKAKYRTIELTGSYGLGVVFLGTPGSSQLNKFIEISENGNLMQIQGVFGGLNDATIQAYRTKQVASLNVELTEATTFINELLNSRSWKITKPFRVAIDLARKIIKLHHLGN